MTFPNPSGFPNPNQPGLGLPPNQPLPIAAPTSVEQPKPLSQNPTSIEPRSEPKPAIIELNGKKYEIIIKNHGRHQNPSPGVSQKFATLFGMTLKYSIAALQYQHKLKKIKLENIKIEKKVGEDGKLFLKYSDAGQKYTLEITNDLEISKTSDKEMVERWQKNANTAKKTYEAAIECLNSTELTSKEQANITGLYELKVDDPDSLLSQNAKNYYDKNKIEPKSSKTLKSTKNKSLKEKNDGSDGSKINISSSKDHPLQEKEDTNRSLNPKHTNSTVSTTSKINAQNLEQESFKVTEEEKNLSNIPDRSINNDGENPNWKNYLLNGTLPKPNPISQRKLQLHQKPSDKIQRSVEPVTFTIKEAKEILNKILNNKSSSLTEKEKIFIKRIILLSLAFQSKKNEGPYDLNLSNDILKSFIKNQLDFIAYTDNFEQNNITSTIQDNINTIYKNHFEKPLKDIIEIVKKIV